MTHLPATVPQIMAAIARLPYLEAIRFAEIISGDVDKIADAADKFLREADAGKQGPIYRGGSAVDEILRK